MAKAKAPAKPKASASEKAKAEEKPAKVKPTPDEAPKIEEAPKTRRGRQAKAEEPAPVKETKPKRTTKATKAAAPKKESSVENDAPVEKTKPASKGESVANGKGKKTKAAAESSSSSSEKESPKKRVKKADEEAKKEEEPPKKRAKNVAAPESPATGVTGKKLQNSVTSDLTIDFNIKEAFKTKIVTWNVAGVRSCSQKGCVEYLRREDADIICLNELKVGTEKDIPDEVKMAGYYHYWNISKGNPGVGILSKKKPLSVTNDLPEKFTTENRLITAEFEDFYLVSCYVVNAGRGLKTLDKRLEWNEIFDKYVKELDEKKPVIIAGDLNVAHNEIDLANPKTNQKNAGFTPEEREGFSKLLSYGFVDTFREKNPDKTGAYTFWSYMGGARAKNVGWRLDYFVVSKRFSETVVDNVIRSTIKGSDHCPIVLFLN